jgi:transposase
MERQYVGIGFHRRRSVIVGVDGDGTKLGWVRVPNDPSEIAAAVAEPGEDAEVIVEVTYGWYWVLDMLDGAGHSVRLANPQG